MQLASLKLGKTALTISGSHVGKHEFTSVLNDFMCGVDISTFLCIKCLNLPRGDFDFEREAAKRLKSNRGMFISGELNGMS